MWKTIKTLAVTLCIISVIAMIGCRSLIDSMTPADIDKRAQDYSEVDPNTIGEWKSLNDAVEVKKEIIIKHRGTQIDLKRMAQDDTILYKDAIGFIDANIEEATGLQELIIGGPENPFSVLGMLAPFGVGALAGSVLIKRRNDYTPEEYEVAVAKANLDKE